MLGRKSLPRQCRCREFCGGSYCVAELECIRARLRRMSRMRPRRINMASNGIMIAATMPHTMSACHSPLPDVFEEA